MERQYPCLNLIYMIPGKKRRQLFLLQIAKSVSIHDNNLLILFESFNNYKELFGLNSLDENKIKNDYYDLKFEKCNIILDSLLQKLPSINLLPCKACPYSSKYVNEGQKHELTVLLYLLNNHTNDSLWQTDIQQKYFKSKILIPILHEPIEGIVYSFSLYNQLFMAGKKVFKKAKQPSLIMDQPLPPKEVLELLLPKLSKSTLKSCGEDMPLILDEIRSLIIKEIDKQPHITEENFIISLDNISKRKKKYIALPFTGDVFKQPVFSGKTDQNGLPNFLIGYSYEKPKNDDNQFKQILEKPIKNKDVTPNIIHSKDEILKLITNINSTNSTSTLTNNNQVNKLTKENILKPCPPIETIDSQELLNSTEPIIDENIDNVSSLFLNDGSINITKELKNFSILPIHKYDILDLLIQLNKESWVGVEYVKNDNCSGLLIYGGRGKFADYINIDLIDNFLLKSLFFNNNILLITQNASRIFALLIDHDIYMLPHLHSLSARYNALKDQCFVFPETELYSLIPDQKESFCHSLVLDHIINYERIDSALGIKLEKINRIKRAITFTHYEFLIGSSMYINTLFKMKIDNLIRENYYRSTFIFNHFFKKLGKGSVVTFQYSAWKDKIIFTDNEKNKLLLYIIGGILKGGILLNYHPRLLYAEVGIISLYVNTCSIDRLSYFEEYMCKNITKRCKEFSCDPPSIEIVFNSNL